MVGSGAQAEAVLPPSVEPLLEPELAAVPPLEPPAVPPLEPEFEAALPPLEPLLEPAFAAPLPVVSPFRELGPLRLLLQPTAPRHAAAVSRPTKRLLVVFIPASNSKTVRRTSVSPRRAGNDALPIDLVTPGNVVKKTGSRPPPSSPTAVLARKTPI